MHQSKTIAVFNEGVLQFKNKKGLVIAFVNFFDYPIEWVRANYPQYFEKYLLILEEPF